MLAEVHKVCFKCGEIKALSAFYKHGRMADGHVNKCKVCNKADVTENRGKRLDFYREYDRIRGSRQTKEDQQRYREQNPQKYAAHVMVGNAIRGGRLVPGDCEVCGDLRVHGHHTDYDKPLEVMWLCSEHHVAWHTANGEGANAHSN